MVVSKRKIAGEMKVIVVRVGNPLVQHNMVSTQWDSLSGVYLLERPKRKRKAEWLREPSVNTNRRVIV